MKIFHRHGGGEGKHTVQDSRVQEERLVNLPAYGEHFAWPVSVEKFGSHDNKIFGAR